MLTDTAQEQDREAVMLLPAMTYMRRLSFSRKRLGADEQFGLGGAGSLSSSVVAFVDDLRPRNAGVIKRPFAAELPSVLLF